MKKRYHIERPRKNDSSTKDGVIVLEAPPQKRTLNYDVGGRQIQRVMTNLPYMIFSVGYSVDTKGRYVNRGREGGIRIFCSDREIKSLNDLAVPSPFDGASFLCTEHYYDTALFETLEELVAFNISFWYNAAHYGYPDNPDRFYSNIAYYRKHAVLNDGCNDFQSVVQNVYLFKGLNPDAIKEEILDEEFSLKGVKVPLEVPALNMSEAFAFDLDYMSPYARGEARDAANNWYPEKK